MFIITAEFLKAFPKWEKQGWKVGDKVDIVSWFTTHPPKKPSA